MMDMDFALFQQVTTGNDDERNVAARFYDKAVKTGQVADNGMPIFKDVTYIEIRLKDNSTEVFNQPATEEKIKRFPREYALYKLAKEKKKEGTPLEQFAFLTASELETCQSRGIFTVEDLASLAQDKVQFLGLQNENELAKKFMQNAKDNSTLAEMVRKEKEYLHQIADLKEQIQNLQQAVKKHSWSFRGDKR
ncbi:MAG: hypothetical protein J6N45_05720 [Alphaproteobacteria bacterium]|nr:hypothetical protein [Alphaproteobacteria bacterium]